MRRKYKLELRSGAKPHTARSAKKQDSKGSRGAITRAQQVKPLALYACEEQSDIFVGSHGSCILHDTQARKARTPRR